MASRKLAPCFVGPFEVERIINPVAVRLKLPALMNVHPTFHVSRIRLVSESRRSPPVDEPPPAQIINGGPAYTVQKILDVRHRGRGWQYRIECEGGLGFPTGKSSTRACSRISTRTIQKSPVERQEALVEERVMSGTGITFPDWLIRVPLQGAASAEDSGLRHAAVAHHRINRVF